MSRYYHLPNKVNLPFIPHSTDLDFGYHCKSKPTIVIESEKKSSIKIRQSTISISKENTPPRHKHHKSWQTIARTTVSKPDPRLMFNFIDSNRDSRLSYLEFRSWMLMIDQTLAEHELYQIFNEIDRNNDGFIQYKEFREYFGDDLLTSEANDVELISLFNEIGKDHTEKLTLEQLLAFFNRHYPMISKEEGEIFLGMISDVGNEKSISLQEFLKAMHEWKI